MQSPDGEVDGETENDGNDIIDIGDDNKLIHVWGQGGNDKIIGGVGEG